MPRLSEAKYPRPVIKIEVAPSATVLPVDRCKIPAIGLFDWIDNNNGTFTPVIRVKDAWLRVSEVEKLPLGLSAEVIVKLWQGGFIEGSAAGPNNTSINVRSLLDHIEECAADPEYWKDSEKLNRYRTGLFGSVNSN